MYLIGTISCIYLYLGISIASVALSTARSFFSKVIMGVLHIK